MNDQNNIKARFNNEKRKQILEALSIKKIKEALEIKKKHIWEIPHHADGYKEDHSNKQQGKGKSVELNHKFKKILKNEKEQLIKQV